MASAPGRLSWPVQASEISQDAAGTLASRKSGKLRPQEARQQPGKRRADSNDAEKDAKDTKDASRFRQECEQEAGVASHYIIRRIMARARDPGRGTDPLAFKFLERSPSIFTSAMHDLG